MPVIRLILPHEAWLLEGLAEEFFGEGDLPGELDNDRFLSIWEMWLAQGAGIVIGAWREDVMVGAIGGLLAFSHMSGDLELNEMFWFVAATERKTGVGIRMLDAFEDEARKRDVVRVTMVHLANPIGEKVGEIFKDRGYAPLETHYCMEL